MSSKLAPVLIGGGVFFLATAALTLTVVQPALLKAPIQKTTTSTSVGPAMALDSATGTQVPGILTQKRNVGTHTVQRNGKAVGLGDDSTAVYDDYAETTFVSSDGSIKRDFGKNLQTQAFDRSTGAGKPGFTSDTLATTAQFFKFPFGTEKKTYSMWNTKAGKAFPATYVRETTVGGVQAYEFKQVVTPTDLGPLPVLKAIPGSFVGEPQTPSIPANQWVEDPEYRYFVEPASGSIVGGSSQSHIWAQTADGRKVDILKLENVAPDQESQARLIKDAKEAHASVSLLKTLPIVAALLGLVLLGLGLYLLRRSLARADQRGEGDPASVDVRDRETEGLVKVTHSGPGGQPHDGHTVDLTQDNQHANGHSAENKPAASRWGRASEGNREQSRD